MTHNSKQLKQNIFRCLRTSEVAPDNGICSKSAFLETLQSSRVPLLAPAAPNPPVPSTRSSLSLAWSHDGTVFAMGMGDHSVRVYSKDYGIPRSSINAESTEAMHSKAATINALNQNVHGPDSKTPLRCNSSLSADFGHFLASSDSSVEPLAILKGHSRTVWSINFHPFNSSFLVAASLALPVPVSSTTAANPSPNNPVEENHASGGILRGLVSSGSTDRFSTLRTSHEQLLSPQNTTPSTSNRGNALSGTTTLPQMYRYRHVADVIVWHWPSSTPLYHCQVEGHATTVQFSPCGSSILISVGSSVRIWPFALQHVRPDTVSNLYYRILNTISYRRRHFQLSHSSLKESVLEENGVDVAAEQEALRCLHSLSSLFSGETSRKVEKMDEGNETSFALRKLLSILSKDSSSSNNNSSSSGSTPGVEEYERADFENLLFKEVVQPVDSQNLNASGDSLPVSVPSPPPKHVQLSVVLEAWENGAAAALVTQEVLFCAVERAHAVSLKKILDRRRTRGLPVDSLKDLCFQCPPSSRNSGSSDDLMGVDDEVLRQRRLSEQEEYDEREKERGKSKPLPPADFSLPLISLPARVRSIRSVSSDSVADSVNSTNTIGGSVSIEENAVESLALDATLIKGVLRPVKPNDNNSNSGNRCDTLPLSSRALFLGRDGFDCFGLPLPFGRVSKLSVLSEGKDDSTSKRMKLENEGFSVGGGFQAVIGSGGLIPTFSHALRAPRNASLLILAVELPSSTQSHVNSSSNSNGNIFGTSNGVQIDNSASTNNNGGSAKLVGFAIDESALRLALAAFFLDIRVHLQPSSTVSHSLDHMFRTYTASQSNLLAHSQSQLQLLGHNQLSTRDESNNEWKSPVYHGIGSRIRGDSSFYRNQANAFQFAQFPAMSVSLNNGNSFANNSSGNIIGQNVGLLPYSSTSALSVGMNLPQSVEHSRSFLLQSSVAGVASPMSGTNMALSLSHNSVPFSSISHLSHPGTPLSRSNVGLISHSLQQNGSNPNSFLHSHTASKGVQELVAIENQLISLSQRHWRPLDFSQCPVMGFSPLGILNDPPPTPLTSPAVGTPSTATDSPSYQSNNTVATGSGNGGEYSDQNKPLGDSVFFPPSVVLFGVLSAVLAWGQHLEPHESVKLQENLQLRSSNSSLPLSSSSSTNSSFNALGGIHSSTSMPPPPSARSGTMSRGKDNTMGTTNVGSTSYDPDLIVDMSSKYSTDSETFDRNDKRMKESFIDFLNNLPGRGELHDSSLLCLNDPLTHPLHKLFYQFQKNYPSSDTAGMNGSGSLGNAGLFKDDSTSSLKPEELLDKLKLQLSDAVQSPTNEGVKRRRRFFEAISLKESDSSMSTIDSNSKLNFTSENGKLGRDRGTSVSRTHDSELGEVGSGSSLSGSELIRNAGSGEFHKNESSSESELMGQRDNEAFLAVESPILQQLQATINELLSYSQGNVVNSTSDFTLFEVPSSSDMSPREKLFYDFLSTLSASLHPSALRSPLEQPQLYPLSLSHLTPSSNPAAPAHISQSFHQQGATPGGSSGLLPTRLFQSNGSLLSPPRPTDNALKVAHGGGSLVALLSLACTVLELRPRVILHVLFHCFGTRSLESLDSLLFPPKMAPVPAIFGPITLSKHAYVFTEGSLSVGGPAGARVLASVTDVANTQLINTSTNNINDKVMEDSVSMGSIGSLSSSVSHNRLEPLKYSVDHEYGRTFRCKTALRPRLGYDHSFELALIEKNAPQHKLNMKTQSVGEDPVLVRKARHKMHQIGLTQSAGNPQFVQSTSTAPLVTEPSSATPVPIVLPKAFQTQLKVLQSSGSLVRRHQRLVGLHLQAVRQQHLQRLASGGSSFPTAGGSGFLPNSPHSSISGMPGLDPGQPPDRRQRMAVYGGVAGRVAMDNLRAAMTSSTASTSGNSALSHPSSPLTSNQSNGGVRRSAAPSALPPVPIAVLPPSVSQRQKGRSSVASSDFDMDVDLNSSESTRDSKTHTSGGSTHLSHDVQVGRNGSAVLHSFSGNSHPNMYGSTNFAYSGPILDQQNMTSRAMSDRNVSDDVSMTSSSSTYSHSSSTSNSNSLSFSNNLYSSASNNAPLSYNLRSVSQSSTSNSMESAKTSIPNSGKGVASGKKAASSSVSTLFHGLFKKSKEKEKEKEKTKSMVGGAVGLVRTDSSPESVSTASTTVVSTSSSLVSTSGVFQAPSSISASAGLGSSLYNSNNNTKLNQQKPFYPLRHIVLDAFCMMPSVPVLSSHTARPHTTDMTSNAPTQAAEKDIHSGHFSTSASSSNLFPFQSNYPPVMTPPLNSSVHFRQSPNALNLNYASPPSGVASSEGMNDAVTGLSSTGRKRPLDRSLPLQSPLSESHSHSQSGTALGLSLDVGVGVEIESSDVEESPYDTEDLDSVATELARLRLLDGPTAARAQLHSAHSLSQLNGANDEVPSPLKSEISHFTSPSAPHSSNVSSGQSTTDKPLHRVGVKEGDSPPVSLIDNSVRPPEFTVSTSLRGSLSRNHPRNNPVLSTVMGLLEVSLWQLSLSICGIPDPCLDEIEVLPNPLSTASTSVERISSTGSSSHSIPLHQTVSAKPLGSSTSKHKLHFSSNHSNSSTTNSMGHLSETSSISPSTISDVAGGSEPSFDSSVAVLVVRSLELPKTLWCASRRLEHSWTSISRVHNEITLSSATPMLVRPSASPSGESHTENDAVSMQRLPISMDEVELLLVHLPEHQRKERKQHILFLINAVAISRRRIVSRALLSCRLFNDAFIYPNVDIHKVKDEFANSSDISYPGLNTQFRFAAVRTAFAIPSKAGADVVSVQMSPVISCARRGFVNNLVESYLSGFCAIAADNKSITGTNPVANTPPSIVEIFRLQDGVSIVSLRAATTKVNVIGWANAGDPSLVYGTHKGQVRRLT